MLPNNYRLVSGRVVIYVIVSGMLFLDFVK